MDPSTPGKRRGARIVTTPLALIAAALLLRSAASPRDASAVHALPRQSEQVVAFETEFVPLTAFDDLQQCNNAPRFAHTIVNLTSAPVVLYADDRCVTPLVEVKPGYGSHVAPGQSFSAN